MKKIFVTVVFLLFLFSACANEKPITSGGTNTNVKGDTNASNISYQTFYDDLSPYGDWIDYPGYGFVWSPYLYDDFTPYLTNGFWVYSDFGWAWNSEFSWGWGPFHYGRWFYDDFYGWLWVPGFDWGPAWVTWGYYDGYYCWSPLGPGFMFYRDDYRYLNRWAFVPEKKITSRYAPFVAADLDKFEVDKITSINNTGKFNGQAFYSGPRSEEVEKAIGARLTPVSFTETIKPFRTKIKNNTMLVYRPYLTKSVSGYGKPASFEQFKYTGPNYSNNYNKTSQETNAIKTGQNAGTVLKNGKTNSVKTVYNSKKPEITTGRKYQNSGYTFGKVYRDNILKQAYNKSFLENNSHSSFGWGNSSDYLRGSDHSYNFGGGRNFGGSSNYNFNSGRRH